MAYNASQGPRELGDIKNEDDPDTQVDFSSDQIALKTGGIDRVTVTNNHVSCSVNHSASAYYGNGANLTNVPASPAGANTQIQFNDGGSALGASANLTFGSNTLSVVGQISSSLGVSGSALETRTTVINDSHISSSVPISGAVFHGVGSALTGLPVQTYSNASNNRVLTSVSANEISGESNLTFNGSVLSVTGQVSSSLGITGSRLQTPTTIIDNLHLSSSVNISASAFYGDGSTLSGLGTAAITTYNTAGDNRVITSVNSSTVQGETKLTFDGNVLLVNASISGSGNISGSSIFVENDIFHTGDPDTKITFGTDTITLTAGNENLLTLTEGSQDVVTVGDGGDVDFAVKTNNHTDTIFVQGDNDKVGIRTSSPLAVLHITGSGIITGSSVQEELFRVDGDAGLGKLFVSGSGNVGIGTLTPAKTLTVVGQISASLGVTGSRLQTANTFIDDLHISSSLNISGAAFFGNGANLTNVPATPAGNNMNVQFNDDGDLAGSNNFSFDGSKVAVVGQISASLGVSGSTLHINDHAIISGSLRAKQILLTYSAWNNTSTNIQFAPFYNVTDTSVPNHQTVVMQPFNGRLVAATWRCANSQGNNSVRLGIHVTGSGQEAPGTAYTGEFVDLNQNGSWTPVTFALTGAQHYTAGQVVAVSIDPHVNAGEQNLTCIWELNMANLSF
jgi:hypothetical protein